MSNIYLEYREKLLALAEEDYRQFQANLNPGIGNILGVRIPKLRALAKELAKGDWREYFELNEDVYFEERMLQGIIIGLLKETPDVVFAEIERFLPKINGWAICDSFSSGLKIAKKEPERMWALVQRCSESDKPFFIRFAVVMMMDMFIDDEHIDEILQRLNSISSEEYYVRMGVAWAVSFCFIKQREKTLVFLRDCRLDDFTYNKALQKIRESSRVSDEDKAMLQNMKRSKR